jgi:hypothetical protein
VKKWDLFISHASEDKAGVALPLADELEAAGLAVWLDSRQLRVGDSIRENVDAGLAACQYGVVILSPGFVARQWPKRELNALFALEDDGTPLILPVWHNVDRAAVVAYSPILADRLALNTRDGLDRVAAGIARVVFGNSRSPAVASPSRGRRLLNLLDSSADPAAVARFLVANPAILESLLGGQDIRLVPGTSYGGAASDIFAGTFMSTARARGWQLLSLGGIAPSGPASAEIEHADAHVTELRNMISGDLPRYRSALPDIRADFRSTIVIGRRDALAAEDAAAIRDFNDISYAVSVRTYDWLVEAALKDKR